MQFKCLTTDYTMKAIEGLESKKSSGHDCTSNTILKVIKASISHPLTIIINQMLTTGIFPDAFNPISYFVAWEQHFARPPTASHNFFSHF